MLYTSPILQLIVLAVIALIVGYIPVEPLFKRIAYIILWLALVLLLLRWFFPGIV
jgi:hypothetical protein